MKKLSFLFILSILFTSVSLTAQYGYDDDFYDDDFYPGYLGDNFSLEGALETFKDSRSVDEFENRINSRDNFVNNLDLNNDGRTDFIRVSDVSEDRNNRLLVMQAVLGRRDVQDVAVIAIEKTGRRRANLQIIGDEYLFGPDMVLEPNDIAYHQNRRGYGPAGDAVVTRGFINVFYWPIVRNIFAPRYTYYRSPYYWGYYPRVWNPWRPFYYNTYYDRCARYRRGFFRPAPAVTIVYVNNYYRPRRRAYSPWIRDRYNRCEVVYNRDRNRNGNRRRDISQTPPERRRDFDRRRGIRDDERLRGGVAGTNTGRKSDRYERSRDDVKVNRNIERGGYFSQKVETSKPSKRGEYGAAPSKKDRDISRSNKSYESTDRSVYKSDKRTSSTKSNRNSDYKTDRRSTSKKSDRGASYGSDRNTSTRPSKSTYKSDRRSSTVKPNRSTSRKSDRSSSYKSDRKSTSKPSRGSYKSDRSSSSVKSNRGSSSSRKSSSVKSAPKRSTSKASRKSSKPSSAFKSSRGSSSRKSTSTKSSKRGKGF